MNATISVLVEVNGREVHIQELAETTDGPALNPRAVFTLLGTVAQVVVPGKRVGTTTEVWRWESEGYEGHANTKATAVAKMLADAGYAEAKLTATIPDLLEGLLGGAA